MIATWWTTGNLHDLYACAILGVATLLEYKFKLVSRLKSFNVIPYFYIMASVGIMIGWAALTFGFDLFKFNGNILLYRTLGVFDVGHWLIWCCVFFVALRYSAMKDLISGWMVVALLVAAHEETWFISYFIAVPANFGETIWFYSPFLVLNIIIVFAYFVLVPKVQKDIMPVLTEAEKTYLRTAWKSRGNFGMKFEYACRRIWRSLPKAQRVENSRLFLMLTVILVFDALWVLAGFPVSIDNIYGPTLNYFNVQTALIENLSWIMPTIVLTVSYDDFTKLFSKRTSVKLATPITVTNLEV